MTNNPKNSLREVFKTLKPQDMAYTGIIFLFIIVVVLLFFFSTGFISKNINKIFYTEEGDTIEALDQHLYAVTAKKLGLSISTSTQEVSTETPPPVLQATATSTNTLDKSTLTLMIKNSTGKKGVAGLLSQTFESAGFNKAQTANEPDTYPVTTLYLKSSKKDFEPMLLEILKKSYPNAVSTTTEPRSADAVIVIGED